MPWVKVSALLLCCAQHEYAQSTSDAMASVRLPARICTADAWLRANTWQQKGTSPTSATWRLSCAAHPWDLANAKPIDWLALIKTKKPDDIACALSLIAFLIASFAVFLHRNIWLRLRW